LQDGSFVPNNKYVSCILFIHKPTISGVVVLLLLPSDRQIVLDALQQLVPMGQHDLPQISSIAGHGGTTQLDGIGVFGKLF